MVNVKKLCVTISILAATATLATGIILFKVAKFAINYFCG